MNIKQRIWSYFFFLNLKWTSIKNVTKNSIFWQCCVKWNVSYYALDKRIRIVCVVCTCFGTLSGLYNIHLVSCWPLFNVKKREREKKLATSCAYYTNDLFIGFSRIVVLFGRVNPFFVHFTQKFSLYFFPSVHIFFSFCQFLRLWRHFMKCSIWKLKKKKKTNDRQLTENVHFAK